MFRYDFLVAELDDLDCVIGTDFLEDFDVSIKFGKGFMSIGKYKIKLEQYKIDRVCRIRVTETITIPPDKEMSVKGSVDSHLDKGTCLVESFQNLFKKGLMMSRSIVNAEQTIVPLSFINFTDEGVRIRKDTSASLQGASIVSPLKSDSEDECTQTVPDHLKPLLDEASENLSNLKIEKVKILLSEFRDVFADGSGKLGQTSLTEHTIDVRDAHPIKIPPYRVPFAQKNIIKDEIAKMLEQDIIEPSNSLWAAPVVLVTKSDKSIRFCVNYRKLNSVTRKDAYPLPKINESLDTLSSSKYFCTLDLASGYWQIPMAENHKQNTAFSTHLGLHKFKVIPFGFMNAPATFKRLIEKVLFGLQWEKCLYYLDNIIVFGRTFEETFQNLKLVLCRFREAILTLKPKKCHLLKKSVQCLGHTVSEDGTCCSPDKVNAVLNWPVPTTKTELRSFLGLINYYRRYFKDLATIAYPLTRLTQKKRSFSWDDDCQKSFETLKQLLVSAPILSYPETDDDFILDTDGSQF